MKIITLVGPPNSGKTATIKELAHLLLQQGGKLCDIAPKNHQRSCITAAKLKLCGGDIKKYKGDITILIDLNGQKIGITSFGDDEKSIKSKYELFLDCDVFVSASHPIGGTIDYIESIVGTSKHIIEIKNKNAYDDSAVAHKIFAHI